MLELEKYAILIFESLGQYVPLVLFIEPTMQ